VGKPTGTQNYSSRDIDELLNAIEAVLPIGHFEWERVQLMYVPCFLHAIINENSL